MTSTLDLDWDRLSDTKQNELKARAVDEAVREIAHRADLLAQEYIRCFQDQGTPSDALRKFATTLRNSAGSQASTETTTDGGRWRFLLQ